MSERVALTFAGEPATPRAKAAANIGRRRHYTHLTPSNTPRMLDGPANKPTPRANSKSKL